jgi:hypothetical protein
MARGTAVQKVTVGNKLGRMGCLDNIFGYRTLFRSCGPNSKPETRMTNQIRYPNVRNGRGALNGAGVGGIAKRRPEIGGTGSPRRDDDLVCLVKNSLVAGIGDRIFFGCGLRDEGDAGTRISRAVPLRGTWLSLVTVGTSLRCWAGVAAFGGGAIKSFGLAPDLQIEWVNVLTKGGAAW